MTNTLRPYLPTIGPYRVVRPLGRGGAAAVYEVEHPATGDRLALKLLTHQLSSARFEREYRTLAALSHPNLVRVYDFGFTEDRFPYLTMELLDGVPAQAHAKASGRPGSATRTAEVVRLATLVSEALDYLHNNRIVHRDLKSSNVMVVAGGGVKLLDLGTARLIGSSEGITRQGEFIGTFTYASPEQLTGRPVDHRADLYSLGVLIYRLLTGRRPFEVDDPHELARLHIEVMAQPPIEIVAGLPPELSNFVMQLLAKKAEERPFSARIVSDTLRQSGLAAPALTLGPPWHGPLPLVGRSRERAWIERFLGEPRPGALGLLGGPRGIGRTRLLAEASQLARARGAVVYEGAFPGASALGALTTIAHHAARDLRRDGTTDPSYAVLRDAPPAPPVATRVVLFLELFSLLRRRVSPEGRPVVLLLHRLDLARPLALQALGALRARAAEVGVPLIFLGTVDAEDGQLAPHLSALQSDVSLLVLPPVNSQECALIVGAMLNTEAPVGALSERIRESSSGIPGHIEFIVRAAVRAGARSRGRLALPPTLEQAAALHLQSSSRLCGRAMEALACTGGEANTDLLGPVADLPPLELRAAMLALAQEGLVQRLDNGGVETWRAAYPWLAKAIRATLPAARQEELRGRVASGLATAPPTAAKVRLLAAAGLLDPAIAEAVPWAERWLDDEQPGEVLPVLGGLAARADEAVHSPPALIARLLLCHARALSAHNPSDLAADRSLAHAMSKATEPARQAEIDLYTAELYRRRGQTERARARLARAARALDQANAPRLHAQVRLARAQEAYDRAEFNAAGAAFEDARRGAERSGDLRTAARARLGLAVLQYVRGELEDAERELGRALSSLSRNQDDATLWSGTVALTNLMRLQGRFSEARMALSRHKEAIRLTGRPEAALGLSVALAEIDLDLERLGEAERLLAPALRPPVTTLPPRLAARVAAALARLHLANGRFPAAMEVVDNALEVARSRTMPAHTALLLAMRGEIRARLGAFAEADSLTATAMRDLESMGHRPALAAAALCRARAFLGRELAAGALAPVSAWASSQNVRSVQVLAHLVSAASASAAGDATRASGHRRQAESVVLEIERLLEAPDREGIRSHSWYKATFEPSVASPGGA